VGTGECKDCFDWEKSAGKGKETEEWLFPGKQTDFCLRGEKRDCLSDCLQWLRMEDGTLSETGKAVARSV